MRRIVVILLLGFTTFYLTASPLANASEKRSAGQYSADPDKGRSERDRFNTQGGANRVDQDLYPFHAGDVNQFGDDGAYNSITGNSSLRGFPPIHEYGP